MRRTLTAFALLAVLAVTIAAANLRREPGALGIDWQLVKETPHEVIADPPRLGAIVQTVTAPGTVEAVDEAEIASQIVGRVIEVRVKDGDRVKKGDLLVKLDPTEAKARVDSASPAPSGSARRSTGPSATSRRPAATSRRRRSSASRGFANAHRDGRRPDDQGQGRAVDGDVRERPPRERGDAADEPARAVRTQILAPIDGVVAGLSVDVGEVVIAGTTNLKGSVLMTVADPQPAPRPGRHRRDRRPARPPRPAGEGLPPGRRAQPRRRHGRPRRAEGDEEGRGRELRDPDLDRRGPARPAAGDVVDGRGRGPPGRAGGGGAGAGGGPPPQKDLPDTPEVRAWAERNARSPGERASEADLRYIKIVFVVEGTVARARPVETGLSDERRIEILSGVGPDDRVVVAPVPRPRRAEGRQPGRPGQGALARRWGDDEYRDDRGRDS